MSTVLPSGIRKHLSRVSADDVAFYYAKKCKVFPALHTYYFEELTKLESQGKVCFTPAAILERYHMNLKRRLEERIKKYATK